MLPAPFLPTKCRREKIAAGFINYLFIIARVEVTKPWFDLNSPTRSIHIENVGRLIRNTSTLTNGWKRGLDGGTKYEANHLKERKISHMSCTLWRKSGLWHIISVGCNISCGKRVKNYIQGGCDMKQKLWWRSSSPERIEENRSHNARESWCAVRTLLHPPPPFLLHFTSPFTYKNKRRYISQFG